MFGRKFRQIRASQNVEVEACAVANYHGSSGPASSIPTSGRSPGTVHLYLTLGALPRRVTSI